MGLGDWLDEVERGNGAAFARLEALPRVQHGVQPPFEIGDKATYDALKGGHLSREIREAPVVDVPLDGIRTIQKSVNADRVAQYLRDPGLTPKGAIGKHGGPIDLPIIVRVGGTRYAHDGHHRLSAAKLSGDTTIKARYVDLDAIRSQR